jgi:hypothetical protein
MSLLPGTTLSSCCYLLLKHLRPELQPPLQLDCGRHIGRSHSLAVVSSAAINISVQVSQFMLTLISLGIYPEVI